MESVMAIESEVCGSCAGEANVLVVVENIEVWLCCGWKYMRFISGGKAAQDWRRKVVVMSGIGVRI